MLSFNNKEIKELSKSELSTQIFNLSNFYKNNNIDIKYTTMTLSIAELLEQGCSDFNFSLKSFKHYLKNPNFSYYEKTIIIEGYKKHLIQMQNKLKKINPKDINLPYYSGVLKLLEVEEIILKYKQLSNNPKSAAKYLEIIERKIFEIEGLKYNEKIKSIINIHNISLKELYFCKKINDFII